MECLLTEREVQLVWLLGLHQRSGLRTEDGRPLEVRFPGFPAGEGGPDFRAARLVLGAEARVGDVEVHLTPDGWRAHGHGRDASYAGVVLHVALRRDPFDRGTRGLAGRIAELILEPYLELPPAELRSRLSPPAPRAAVPELLGTLGWERVASRVRVLERLARVLGPDGALYRELMVGLGYRANTPGFAELARLVPWERVRLCGASEVACLYEAASRGIAWRRPGRPANHPRCRMQGWARFVGSLGNEGLLAAFGASVQSSERRLDPDGAGLIGPDRARDLVANAVLPALLAAGPGACRGAVRERLRGSDRSAPNRRLREAATALGIGVPHTMIERLGLLEWRARQ